MNTRFLPAAMILVMVVLSVNAGTIFDSVEEFSGTQGQDNWYCGYYDGDGASPYTSSDFEEMPQFINGNQWIIHRGDPTGYWTSLYATGGHPNGPVGNYYRGTEHWAVRRWVSDVAGAVSIEGNLSKSSRSGDGTICHILVNDVVVFSQHLTGKESGGIDYSVEVELTSGDTIDFAIQPGASDMYDSTRFAATGTMISSVEPPVIGIVQPLNSSGCIEATSPDGALLSAYVANFLDQTNIVYYWSNLEGSTETGQTFDFPLGVNQSTTIFLTVMDLETGHEEPSFEQVRVSDTTPPLIEILDPQPGARINGNNLFLNAAIVDIVDTNIVDYTVNIGTTAKYPVDPESGVTRVHLFKPAVHSGSTPADITVIVADTSGNTSQATVQVMMQHDNRK